MKVYEGIRRHIGYIGQILTLAFVPPLSLSLLPSHPLSPPSLPSVCLLCENLENKSGGRFSGSCTLRDITFAGAFTSYVEDSADRNRRVILVPALDLIPDDVKIGAVLLGARLQTDIFRSLALAYHPLGKHVFSCTSEFCKAHKLVVQVVKASCNRNSSEHTFMKLSACIKNVNSRIEKSPNARVKTNTTIFTVSEHCAEVGDLCTGGRQVLRTLHSFFSDMARNRRV